MSTHTEAVRLNLEYYRKQAKSLLKAAQSGDTSALKRISDQSSNLGGAALKLHDAQFTVAREQGFPSWPRFRAFIVQSGLDYQSLVAAFIDAAVSDRRRAEEMLSANPKLEGAGFYVDLVLGNWTQVEPIVAARPEMVTVPSGPQNCVPLLYVCFSRFARGGSSRSAGLVETARVLLRHGADPNTALIPEDMPENPLPCLYAATGLNNNPELGLALLAGGANPNDAESLYHSTEHRDLSCMKLLLRHGATHTGLSNVLKHMLDREEIEGLKLLLEAGANPNETDDQGETALHWAIRRGRGASVIQVLLDRGVDLNATRKDGRTAYAMAAVSGDSEVTRLLKARGANTDLSEPDRALARYTNPDLQDVDRPPAIDPQTAAERERLVPDLAMSHRTAAVRALLAAGMPVDARGEAGATALHWACWKGYADLVEMLLAHGASLTVEDHEYQGTPPGWFGHGSQNCTEGDGDYAQVARLLIAAGATIPTLDIPTGRPDVDAVLKEHGLI